MGGVLKIVTSTGILIVLFLNTYRIHKTDIRVKSQETSLENNLRKFYFVILRSVL